MPCAECKCWIEGAHRIYKLQSDHGSSVSGWSLSGSVEFSIETTGPLSDAALRRQIARALEVSDYRVVLHGRYMVQIRGEWLRWKVCEALHHRYISNNGITIWSKDGRQWYFICESCRQVMPHLRHYENINHEGGTSTGTSDSDG